MHLNLRNVRSHQKVFSTEVTWVDVVDNVLRNQSSYSYRDENVVSRKLSAISALLELPSLETRALPRPSLIPGGRQQHGWLVWEYKTTVLLPKPGTTTQGPGNFRPPTGLAEVVTETALPLSFSLCPTLILPPAETMMPRMLSDKPPSSSPTLSLSLLHWESA